VGYRSVRGVPEAALDEPVLLFKGHTGEQWCDHPVLGEPEEVDLTPVGQPVSH
jgi:hypothetical protein